MDESRRPRVSSIRTCGLVLTFFIVALLVGSLLMPAGAALVVGILVVVWRWILTSAEPSSFVVFRRVCDRIIVCHQYTWD